MENRTPNTICQNCNKPCYVRPNQMQSQTQWTCSKECWNQLRPRKRPKSCAYCEQPIGRGSKYCSRMCSNKGRTGIKYDGIRPNDHTRWHGRIRAALLEREGTYECEICKISEWNGKKITLQIDHIDGHRTNNELNNLRHLCPNCHSQTPTFGVQHMKRNNGVDPVG